MHVVWFKRDLRVQDNSALAGAAQHGPVLPLYIVEPDLWRQPDSAARHWHFIAESLASLRQDLFRLGAPLVIRVGDAVDVLAQIHREHGIDALWSHEETGNAWTFDRDKRVAAFCRAMGFRWHEPRQNGVIRRLKNRDGWAKAWDNVMGLPVADVPQLAPLGKIDPGAIPEAASLGLEADPCPERQRGGRERAEATLNSFLVARGLDYRRAMASPLSGAYGCSRLSPHLAFGTISLKEVSQATRTQLQSLKGNNDVEAKRWRASLISFLGRLHWHCHFIQKLETEPRIEFENFHPAYDALRPHEPDHVRLAALAAGETGFPFVDACMRSLAATGWLNFRMRAMLMSFASYHLWLPWRESGLVLARLFTDYEPGIHWPQTQMQSGTTGINTVRVYNPVKQGFDQDPDGVFVRRWVPELAEVPDTFLHEPWKWTGAGAGDYVGKRYPDRIVDHVAAAKLASEKVWGVRREVEYREKADTIQQRHGSRKSGLQSVPVRGKRKPRSESTQLTLDFGARVAPQD